MALFPFSGFCGIALCVCLLKKLRGKRTAIIFLQVFVNMNSYHFQLSSFTSVESNYYLGYQIIIWGHFFNPVELCYHLPSLYYRNRKYITFLFLRKKFLIYIWQNEYSYVKFKNKIKFKKKETENILHFYMS